MLTLRPSHYTVKCIQADIITEKKTELAYILHHFVSCLKYLLGETTIECPVNTNIVRINCRM